MQQTKKKLVLEHLVVQKLGSKADLQQAELDEILRYGARQLFEEPAAAAKAEPPPSAGKLVFSFV